MKSELLNTDRIIQKDELRIIHYYRYASWFLTSLFYLLSETRSPWIIKSVVIIVMFASAVLTIGVYNRFDGNSLFERSFIFAETIGITLILFPTGGLHSPFIWYALNPVLIAAIFMPYYMCWFNLFCYLFASSLITYQVFNPEKERLWAIIANNSQSILIFILITLAAQLLSALYTRIRDQRNHLIETNIQLNQANIRNEEAMDYIMSLYQTVEAIASQDNKIIVYQTFSDYAARLTGGQDAFFWSASNPLSSDSIYTSGMSDPAMKAHLLSAIKKQWKGSFLSKEIISLQAGDYHYSALIVQSTSRKYGLIGIRTSDDEPKAIRNEYAKQLGFLSELSAIILERFHLEELTDKLMIVEEQNRIANEMHDSVAQRLFGMSCALHSVLEGKHEITDQSLKETLRAIQESTHVVMKELRSAIYKLSTRKGGQKGFLSDIRDYLDNVAGLNNVIVNFDFDGDDELISVSMKRGLYRIICEASGNAIRHGNCTSLFIELRIDRSKVELTIADNGKGFVMDDKLKEEQAGLGLQNMRRLVELYDGSLNIHSQPTCGTRINIMIPNVIKVDQYEGDIAI